ncbi:MULTISPECIES: type II toxin-antitoxin system HicA family toxin [unclassified Methanoculleus]|uniref:type II toxin-antitoxin system HicA family toxin n=1 Tax=unclassified Methanoculleus TaxID=2619537 RepID=UPI003741FF55
MPHLPVVSSTDIIRVLKKLGYSFVHQRGSHIKMVKQTDQGNHIVIIPFRTEKRQRTLNNILNDIANHNDMTKQELIALFLRG